MAEDNGQAEKFPWDGALACPGTWSQSCRTSSGVLAAGPFLGH